MGWKSGAWSWGEVVGSGRVRGEVLGVMVVRGEGVGVEVEGRVLAEVGRVL